MNANLQSQQSLLRLKLIEAGKRLHNQATESRENVAEYDDIAKDSEISDTDSYDTVYNEGPYRPVDFENPVLVTRGTSEPNYEEVGVEATVSMSNLVRNLSKLNYTGYAWSVKE